MAAGIVYHNITTASGVTFSLACWVPDTASPDVGAIPVSLPVKSDGTVADPTTFATQATLASALTALQLIDDPVATLGTTTYSEATSKGMIAGAVRRDANTSLVDTTNEVAPLQVNATGELKVAQIQALPAGTNAIGKLAANSGVDIGDVDVTTVGTITPGTAATSLGKAIDSAAGATDTGVAMLGIRDDTLSTLTPVDGDYVTPRFTSTGALWTQDAGLNNNGQATAANSSPVVIASDRQNSVVFDVTMSTDTSAYASGDLIADTQQLDAFFNKTDGRGVINSVTIIDEAAQSVKFYVIFHSTSTSMGTENSAPNISDANASAGIQGVVTVDTTDYITISGTSTACVKNIGLPVKAVSGTDDLYVSILNATGTPTYTATSLKLRIGALLD